MEILGVEIPGVLIGMAIGIVAAVAADRAAVQEEEKNERFEKPSPKQVSWHILHGRQDLRLIAILLTLILITLWIKL